MSLNESNDDYYGDDDPFGDDAALATGQEYNFATASYEPPAPMRKIRPTLITPLGRGSKYRFRDMLKAAEALAAALANLQDPNDPMKITFEIDPVKVAQTYRVNADAIKALLRGAGVYFSAQEDPRSPGIWVINM